MIDIRREKFGRHDIETIADNDGIMWLNEKKNRRMFRSSKFAGIYIKTSFKS